MRRQWSGRRRLFVAGASAGLASVVVVSAMAKVTDQLLAAASAAGRGDRAGALAIAARLRHRHIDTTAALAGLRERLCASSGGAGPGVRCAGRSAARDCGGWRADSANERSGGELRRDGFRAGWWRRPLTSADSTVPTWTRAPASSPTPLRQGHPARERDRREAAAIVLPLVEAGKTPVMGGFIGSTIGRHYDHAGTRRQRLHRCAGRRRTARRSDRDMDGRQRHHDDRSAHLSRCAAGEDHQL